MWEHELPLSRTPTSAGRDSLASVHPATRVTRLMILAIVLEEESPLLRTATLFVFQMFYVLNVPFDLPFMTKKGHVYFVD